MSQRPRLDRRGTCRRRGGSRHVARLSNKVRRPSRRHRPPAEALRRLKLHPREEGRDGVAHDVVRVIALTHLPRSSMDQRACRIASTLVVEMCSPRAGNEFPTWVVADYLPTAWANHRGADMLP